MLLFAQWVVFADERPTPDGLPELFSLSDDRVRAVSDTVKYDSVVPRQHPDSLFIAGPLLMDTLRMDSLPGLLPDSLAMGADSLSMDTIPHKPILDEPITGKSDSMFYNVHDRMIYLYHQAEVNYTDMTLIADYMEVDMATKIVFARGEPDDSTGAITRPIFRQEGSEEMTMDTILYNLDSGKGRSSGLFTKDGEGYLHGGKIKRMPDKSINIAKGKFTTCDQEHPHFYFDMSKAIVIPNTKLVMGFTHLVVEDVPLPIIFVPFLFVPLGNRENSGFIMPTFGEQSVKGFFIRNGGYYFVPNDYIDLTVLGGIYTLGSWETSLASRYKKRYAYTGNLSLTYNKEIFGEKNDDTFSNMTNYSIRWTHQQDPKARPNTSFNASVDYSSSNQKYSAQNINDYVTNQTNSSVSYSKNWPGKPYSLTATARHSQSRRDSTVMLSFPNVNFTVSRLYPFKRKNPVGKLKWYENINLSYNASAQNSVTVKENELFKEEMFKSMKNGINHSVPINTNINLFKYINITPSFNYTERWYFEKRVKEWNPETNRQEITDTLRGFYRVYDYSYSASMTTNVYGNYFVGRNNSAQFRHVMTPTIGISFRPDFSSDKFGYYKPIQADSTGRIDYYSPYDGGIYGVPGRSKSANINFSLKNTLEMKVRSQRDSTGVKKIKVLDELSFRGSYNLLADSLNLSKINVNLRSTIIKDFAINLNMVFDTYVVDKTTGRRINKFLISEEGKLARLESVSTQFQYNLNGGAKPMNTNMVDPMDPTGLYPEEDEDGDPVPVDYTLQRMMMTSQYYDFSIPYNFGVNYSISYRNTGIKKTVTQTMGFNASVTLTPKWAIGYNGGYDFKAKKLTPGSFRLERDLHCAQMSFYWVPTGFMQSWSFYIGVKSGMLRDVKYDKRSSHYDNFYDH